MLLGFAVSARAVTIPGPAFGCKDRITFTVWAIRGAESDVLANALKTPKDAGSPLDTFACWLLPTGGSVEVVGVDYVTIFGDGPGQDKIAPICHAKVDDADPVWALCEMLLGSSSD